MNEADIDRSPPVSGSVYGETVFWCALAGVLIACTGLIWQVCGGPAVLDADTLITDLWNGKSPSQIWANAQTGSKLTGHWYIRHLSSADGLALFGAAVCCFSAIAGMWAAVITFISARSEKQRPMYLLYLMLAAVIAATLTLNTAGIFSLH